LQNPGLINVLEVQRPFHREILGQEFSEGYLSIVNRPPNFLPAFDQLQRQTADAAGLRRTLKTSIAKRSTSCASLPSGSCYEGFVLPDNVPGQTVRAVTEAHFVRHWAK
jgi:hypothetical protein